MQPLCFEQYARLCLYLSRLLLMCGAAKNSVGDDNLSECWIARSYTSVAVERE